MITTLCSGVKFKTKEFLKTLCLVNQPNAIYFYYLSTFFIAIALAKS